MRSLPSRCRDARRPLRGRPACGGRDSGLCEIAPDPGRGLLFTSSGATLGSERDWHLDPEPRSARLVAPGYHPATSAAGGSSSPGTGADGHQLWVSAPGGVREIVPPRGELYSCAALSPDGLRLAAVRGDRGFSVAAGRIGEPLPKVWRLGDGRQLGRVAWLRGGRELLVHVFHPRSYKDSGCPLGAGRRLAGAGRPRRVHVRAPPGLTVCPPRLPAWRRQNMSASRRCRLRPASSGAERS